MSSVYISEPAATAKLIMSTSSGDLEIELWCKEAPATCRAFISLALAKAYNSSSFTRLVPDFLVQGGSIASSPCPFPRLEKHSRLAFNRRGLLGAATETDSQIFFTLAAAADLNGKHTLFGKIVGDSVYNLLKIGEMTVVEEDRPMYLTTILDIRVISHPFTDLVIPEIQPALTVAKEKKDEKAVKAVKKDKKLLSFAADDGDEDESEFVGKIKSSHDVLNDKKLSKKVALTSEEIESSKSKNTRKSTRPVDDVPTILPIEALRNERIENVKNEIDQTKRQIIEITSSHSAVESSKKEKKKSILQQEFLSKYSALQYKKRKRNDTEQDKTLKILESFKSKLTQTTVEEPLPSKSADIPPCFLHNVINCKSCKDTFGKDLKYTSDDGWMAHQLVFEKDGNFKVASGNDPYELVVIDPLKKKTNAS